MGRLQLQQRLRGHDDRGKREADHERRGECRGRVNSDAEKERAGAHPRQAPQHHRVVPRVTRERANALGADQHSHANRRAHDAEDAGARVQRFADINGDERPEAADREQTRPHRDHHELHGRMTHDEPEPFGHVAPQRADAAIGRRVAARPARRRGIGSLRTANRHRCDESR